MSDDNRRLPPPKDYLEISTYEFKCNIARYLRMLQRDGAIKKIVINQYKKPVALVVPLLHPKDNGR
ncbi:MAG TPA: hypothetical protein PLF01_03770 [Alphaproteobacteria bacterium]|nr:hypothetical protein [Alphaproteobacteria bacterium]